jgi:sugar phosphate isomerase/epimerase
LTNILVAAYNSKLKMRFVTMKLGCSTVLFNQLDLYGALQHISWAGYEGADLSDIKPARHIKLDIGKLDAEEVKYFARKHGLEIFSIDTEDDGNNEEDKIKSLVKVFIAAQKLDIPLVAPYLHGQSGDKNVTKRNLSYIKKLTEQAESRGIMLAIKIHVGTPIDKMTTLIQILDEIDSVALGIILDTRELCRAGEDISEYISKIGKRIVHVHFRDYPRREQMPTNIAPSLKGFGQYEPWLPPLEQTIPGRGGLDFPKILKLLKSVGYNKAVDLVMTGAFTYPLSRQMGIAGEGRGYLNRCLQELK